MKRLKLRHLILLAAMSPPLLCAAAPLVPRIARRIETSEVRSQKLELVYGETVDLEVKFLAYGATMDIAGAAVTLHARTNGMEEGVSWQTSGDAGEDGTATVRIDVDAWLPAGITTGTWTLEVAQTNAVKVLRGGGTLTLSGTGAGLTNAPLPASVASELWAALYGTNTILNAAITNEAALRAAGDAAGLDALNGTNTVLSAAITNEAALREAGDAANAAALASYADTNRVTRLYGEGGETYALADGTLYQMQIVTNYARAFTNSLGESVTETSPNSSTFSGYLTYGDLRDATLEFGYLSVYGPLAWRWVLNHGGAYFQTAASTSNAVLLELDSDGNLE